MDRQGSFEDSQREHPIRFVFGDLDETGEARGAVHLAYAR
jgi:hypothetical protein